MEARPFQNGTVHRNAPAGSDQNGIANLDLGSRNLYFLSVSKYRSRFRRQIHQLPDRISRFALCSGFQKFPQGDERKNHSGRFKVQIIPVVLHQTPDTVACSPSHTKQSNYAV